jgi:hypothetical protein
MPGQVHKLFGLVYFRAMLFSFATSSSVQSRRVWVIALFLLNKRRPNTERGHSLLVLVYADSPALKKTGPAQGRAGPFRLQEKCQGGPAPP